MKRTKDEELADEAKAVIGRQTDQLVHLVDDLLDVSRITRGKVELHEERVTLSEIVTMALESSRPLIEERDHNLQISLPDTNTELYGDKVRLAQVLLNLLNNAAKYTNPGGKISLSAVTENNFVVIRVSDTGVGIPAKDLPHIFDLFVRVEREGGQEGLGIGLNLVKQLVELHGGKIEAYSAGEGRGSAFTVWLPLLKDGNEAEKGSSSPGESEAPEQRRPEDRTASQRVLVVDDYEPNRKTIARLLGLMGCEVMTARGGEEALEHLTTFKPDLILLDINMPGMSGYEVAARIRAQPQYQHIMLVALTGYGQETDVQRAKDAGFHHHLVKPVEIEKLQAVLE
jgi:CheY-like chemotaxis protein